MSKHVFKFGDIIDSQLKKCNLLAEKKTLESLKPRKIDGKSTLPKIEKTKRDLELFESNVVAQSEKLKVEVEQISETKCLSTLSLCFFFLNVSALILCGLKFIAAWQQDYWGCFWLFLNGFNLIYVLMIYIFGKEKEKRLGLNFSLIGGIRFFCSSLFVSLVLAFLFGSFRWMETGTTCGKIFTLITVALPWLNFVGYYFLIKAKEGKMRKQIKEISNDWATECNTIKEEVKKLISLNDLSIELTSIPQSDK
ncbi:MAG: hypothetical protein MdMp024_0448 [Bacteroidales bacterium]